MSWCCFLDFGDDLIDLFGGVLRGDVAVHRVSPQFANFIATFGKQARQAVEFVNGDGEMNHGCWLGECFPSAYFEAPDRQALEVATTGAGEGDLQRRTRGVNGLVVWLHRAEWTAAGSNLHWAPILIAGISPRSASPVIVRAVTAYRAAKSAALS